MPKESKYNAIRSSKHSLTRSDLSGVLTTMLQLQDRGTLEELQEKEYGMCLCWLLIDTVTEWFS